ncbi:MAG TPA: preprotein translocase subunit SecG [Chitinophagaceae bacterium]|jgi:protein translocase, SecG subunit
MTLLFVILIVIVSVALGFIVLVQNPKGGGLAGNIAGFSTQFMGVKQTNDVLERGTWIFAAVIALLCMASTLFITKSAHSVDDKTQKIGTPAAPAGNTVPSNQTTFPGTQPATTTTQADSTK